MDNTLKKTTGSKGVYNLVRKRFEAPSPECRHHKTGVDTHDSVFDEGHQAVVPAKTRSNFGKHRLWIQR